MLINIIILVYTLGYVVAWRKISAVLYSVDYAAAVKKNDRIGWGIVVADGLGGMVCAVLWPIIGTCVFIRNHSTPETAAKRLFGETAKQKTARQEQEKRALAQRTRDLEHATGVKIPETRQTALTVYQVKKRYYKTWD